MPLKSIQLLTVLSVAVYLIPTGAHLFEFHNKISLSPADYMTVQQIYRGWEMFGIAVVAALVLTLLHTVMRRRDRAAFLPSLLAFLCIVGTQVIFWLFTFPMNVASKNWTVMPQHFEAARRQWEYSHVASAVLTLFALIAIVHAVVVTDRATEASLAA